jgi:hypothetical protein
LSRKPRKEEVNVLLGLYSKHARQYANDKRAAERLLSTGAHRRPKGADVSELAAWTSVARVILNVHEMVTRY